jgi:enamine deaminase RidA (YjgF/YER057c/UK114 family)
MPKVAKPTGRTAANGAKFYGNFHFPISPVVRAGDFVITSAFPGHMPQHEDQVYTAEGIPLASGQFRNAHSFAEESHACFKKLTEVLSLADCTLADVIDCQVWLSDPRNFAEFNRIYIQYFTDIQPVRSVFHNHFMMDLQLEMKMMAYKPLNK